MFINLFVLEYKQNLCQNYSLRSANSMLSSLNAFFSFVGWNDLQVKTLKIQRRIFSDKPKGLTKFEYEKLLTAAKNKNNYRLYYLMQTIASTGQSLILCKMRNKGRLQFNKAG